MTTRDNAPLGKRILGFQHFGLTVQNMDRAYAFYTDVLGGTEVMRDGDFHGEKIQNTLMLNDEIEAHEKKINPATNGVPDLRNGEQRLDVRFIQFDNMVLELLHYRENKEPMGTGAAWAPAHEHRSPAYPRSLHLCFHLRDDVDFNKFIHDLEAEAARRGMTNVRANRTVAVVTEEGRKKAPLGRHVALHGAATSARVVHTCPQLGEMQSQCPKAQRLNSLDAGGLSRGFTALVRLRRLL